MDNSGLWPSLPLEREKLGPDCLAVTTETTVRNPIAGLVPSISLTTPPPQITYLPGKMHHRSDFNPRSGRAVILALPSGNSMPVSASSRGASCNGMQPLTTKQANSRSPWQKCRRGECFCHDATFLEENMGQTMNKELPVHPFSQKRS